MLISWPTEAPSRRAASSTITHAAASPDAASARTRSALPTGAPVAVVGPREPRSGCKLFDDRRLQVAARGTAHLDRAWR